MPVPRVPVLMKACPNLDHLVRLDQAIVERIGGAVQQGTAQSSMDDGTSFRVRSDKVEGAGEIAKEVLTQLWPSRFVPRLGLGDVPRQRAG